MADAVALAEPSVPDAVAVPAAVPDPVALAVLQQLSSSLLVSTVPAEDVDRWDADQAAMKEEDEIYGDGELEGAMSCMGSSSSAWFRSVDFVVDAGPRPLGGSTIFDLTDPDVGPILIREGLGCSELFF